jgi:hypothetical protein
MWPAAGASRPALVHDAPAPVPPLVLRQPDQWLRETIADAGIRIRSVPWGRLNTEGAEGQGRDENEGRQKLHDDHSRLERPRCSRRDVWDNLGRNNAPARRHIQ